MDASIPREPPENPYAVSDVPTDPPVWPSGRPATARTAPEASRAPRGVYERGLAACRAILREHGAPEHGPLWKPRPEK